MTDETKRIVEWLRGIEAAQPGGFAGVQAAFAHVLADAIERGDHLKDKTE